MKKSFTFILMLAVALSAGATVPHRSRIPDIPGYKTLKGDFHIHTNYSDARVPMFQWVSYEKGEYRPMTLVFDKERSLDGIDSRKPWNTYEFDVYFYVNNWLTDADTPLMISYHVSVPAKYRT